MNCFEKVLLLPSYPLFREERYDANDEVQHAKFKGTSLASFWLLSRRLKCYLYFIISSRTIVDKNGKEDDYFECGVA